jgi:uncharacterized protein
MTSCFFVSDLHGHTSRYQKLFNTIAEERPAVVFLGGDLLPQPFARMNAFDVVSQNFINDYLASGFLKLREKLADTYPRVFLILGNDDSRFEEAAILDAAAQGVWEYVHNRRVQIGNFFVYGYSYVPPTPFQIKDWERYDVSRFVDPGCVSPEEGRHSVPVSENELKYSTIQNDIELLAGDDDLSRSLFLFHTPPYQTNLDRAALDGKMVDHVPLDVNVGSIAVKRFIELRRPLVTLHGHVHESARLTGSWKDQIGTTYSFSAAHHGPELALVRFNFENPGAASRQLI